jgi:hypothetical protein
MVGSLLYLASWTRPDISFAVSDHLRFVSNPGKPNLEADKREFRYLKKTISFGLTYRSSVSIPSMPEILPNTLRGYVESLSTQIGLAVPTLVGQLLGSYSC